jgi:hypothetical protein
MNKLEKLPDHIVIKFLNYVKRLIEIPDTLGEFYYLITEGLRKDLIEAISGPLGKFEDRLSIEYLYYLLVNSTDDKVVRPTRLNKVEVTWDVVYKIRKEERSVGTLKTYFDSNEIDEEYLNGLVGNEEIDPLEWDNEILKEDTFIDQASWYTDDL